MPDRVLPQEAARSGFDAAAGRRLRRRARVPAARREPRAARSRRRSSGSSPRKGSASSAGATCRPTTARSAPRAVAAEPVVQAAVHRPRRARERAPTAMRLRAEAVRDPQADRARGRPADPRPRRAVFYIVSLSARTLIYKGMLTASQIAPFFLDLADPRVESALALVHQRFSTNTFPRGRWPTRTATSRTTARSTRCAATSTGCRRARRCCGPTCSATTCRRCCRSSARAAATPRRSTTCSSSW